MAEAAVLSVETPVLPMTESAPGTRSKPGPKPGYKPFNNEVTPEDFFVMLKEIDDADWPKSLVYVWRRDPFTDNTNGGREPKYIDVANRPLTELSMKEEHGSGTYKLQLNTNDKYVAHTIVTLEDPKYPPHVPPGDWFQHPRNKKWLTWKPLVEKWWQERLKDLAGPAPTAGSDNPALQELTRLVAHLANNPKSSEADGLTKVLITWALQQTADERKAEREADSPGKLAELIRAMREFAPTPAQDNTMLTFLLAELKSSREQQTLLMTKLFEIKSEQTKQPDPLSQVKTMAELITLVSGIVQPPLAKEPWQDVVETLGPEVLKTVNTVAGAFAMGARPNPPRPQPHVVTVQPQPVSQTPVQPQPVQSQTVPPVPEPVPAPIPEPADTMDTGMRSMIYQVAVLATNALNLGMLGEQFADQVCYKFGQAVYDQFIAAVPKETLLDRFKSVPEAWQLLQPFETQLPSFIESFYAFATEEPEEEPKTISEPEPVKPRKGAKKK